MKNAGWRLTTSYTNYSEDIDEALEYAPQEAVMTGLVERPKLGYFTHKGWRWYFEQWCREENTPMKIVKPKKNDHKGKKSIRTAVTAYDEEMAMLDEMEVLSSMA